VGLILDLGFGHDKVITENQVCVELINGWLRPTLTEQAFELQVLGVRVEIESQFKESSGKLNII
jgi:hypothetical protein